MGAQTFPRQGDIESTSGVSLHHKAKRSMQKYQNLIHTTVNLTFNLAPELHSFHQNQFF